MIIINNKFDIGEEVFSIWSVPLKKKCDMCEGDGVIEYNGKSMRCPQCKGAKFLVNDKYKLWEVMPQKLKVYSIKASTNGTEVNIKYKASGWNRGEMNLFKTLEEAQARCDELNHADDR